MHGSAEQWEENKTKFVIILLFNNALINQIFKFDDDDDDERSTHTTGN